MAFLIAVLLAAVTLVFRGVERYRVLDIGRE